MRTSERQRCDICGEEIRVVGNTELSDGHICRDCADQLSPWFTEDLDCTSIEEIQFQLSGRDENQDAIPDFHPSRKFGGETMVVVDDEDRTFCVTDTPDLYDYNIDIIPLENVSYCSVTPEEERVEVGPKQYLYRYKFLVEIGIDDWYIDEIRFYLNEEPLEYESSEKGFLGFGGFDPEGQPDYDELAALGEKIENVLSDMDDEEDDRDYSVADGEFNTTGSEEEIEEGARPDGNGTYTAGKIVKCPWCGANTAMNESFTCEHCGGPL